MCAVIPSLFPYLLQAHSLLEMSFCGNGFPLVSYRVCVFVCLCRPSLSAFDYEHEEFPALTTLMAGAARRKLPTRQSKSVSGRQLWRVFVWWDVYFVTNGIWKERGNDVYLSSLKQERKDISVVTLCKETMRSLTSIMSWSEHIFFNRGTICMYTWNHSKNLIVWIFVEVLDLSKSILFCNRYAHSFYLVVS